MTISEIVSRVNILNPNTFDEETKGETLCSFESRLIYKFTGKEQSFIYPDDMKTELILPDRYADVYIYYLSAMLYFWNQEYEEYNNHVTQYNALLEEYVKESGSVQKHGKKRFFNLF